jgi:tRNA pseudouridine32 synthase/23S rRNA pseudouridine746 synthase
MSFSADDVTYNPPMDPVSYIYKDENLLVLDKPSGLLSVPGRDIRLADSLAKRVQAEFPEGLMINRLDKDTSGIVLMSRNRPTHAFIGRQFEERRTSKMYQAIVYGHIVDDEGEIDLPLASDLANKPRHRVDHEHGKAAVTRWRVIERLDGNRTRVALHPLTGRTHQLRVHMLAIGHVITGDPLYAEGDAFSCAPRLMLHSEETCFEYPQGVQARFHSPCPF